MANISGDRSEERKKWKKEVSAGGVVYKKEDGKVLVLLCMPRERNFGKPAGRWSFPKGWVGDHPDEKLEETALREVREEGGVNAEIKGDLGESRYFFRWQGENILKTVHYYLMEYVSGDIEDHDEETAEARWVEITEAGDMLKFKEDREILEKAAHKLSEEHA